MDKQSSNHDLSELSSYIWRVGFALLMLTALIIYPWNPTTAQPCLPYGIRFTTQQEVNGFANDYMGCTEIGGNVLITGNNITNLNGLSGIEQIHGNLIIKETSGLYNLIGLSSLITVQGYLIIENNPSLINCAGLDNLTQIGKSLIVRSNNLLLNLGGLFDLAAIGQGVNIANNQSMTGIDGLNSLISIDSLLIQGNNNLSSIAGLENLTTVHKLIRLGDLKALSSFMGLNSLEQTGNFSIINCNNFDLRGLASLRNIAGNLSLSNCKRMNNLSGIENLESIDKLSISYNDSLENLNTSSLRSLSSLSITNCPLLKDLDGLQFLDTIHKDLTIASNIALSSLKGLENLRHVGGDLVLGSYSLYNNYLTDLSALDNLNSIEGSLYIDRQIVLTSINGFGNLLTIGGDLEIIVNNALKTLNGFTNLHSIGRNMTIYGPSIENINGLSNLIHIGGAVKIGHDGIDASISGIAGLRNLRHVMGNFALINTLLTDFAGFHPTIKFHKGINISYNEFLAGLTALIGIDTIHGDLKFGYNSLLNFKELSSLKVISGGLALTEGPNLTSYEGFENLESIHGYLSLKIPKNITPPLSFTSLRIIGGSFSLSGGGGSKVTNLDGLQNLLSIGGSLIVSNSSTIEDLTGLNNLTHIGGSIRACHNQNLKSFAGLEKIISLPNGSIMLCHWIESWTNINKNLESLNGLNNLEYISGDLYIARCPKMLNLNGLEKLKKVGGNVQIGRQEEFFGYYDSLQNLEGLDSLRVIGGSLSLNYLSVLNSVKGLDHLDSIDGVFQVGYLNTIKNFNNLTSLKYVSSISIKGLFSSFSKMDSLEDLSVFSKINELKSLKIYFAPSLKSLNGFQNLIKVGDLKLERTALCDFTGLESLKEIDGAFYIARNYNLKSFSGLQSLQSIVHDEGIRIFSNDSLADISALKNVRIEALGFHFYQNPLLTSIHGLENFDFEKCRNLRIYENPNLSTCSLENLCDYLQNPGGSVSIYDNAPGCSSEQEILDACETVDQLEIVNSESTPFHPNPAHSFIHIQTSPDKPLHIKVYGITGQLIIETTTETRTLDVSSLQEGTYIAEFSSGETTTRNKLLILR